METFISTSTLDKLLHIAEILSLDECEAVKHGQEPCPLNGDDEEGWCLTCVARKAMAEYRND